MSQRSIIEINHDYSHLIEADSEAFLLALGQALASGSDRSWEPLSRWGVRRVVQVHHSDNRAVVVRGDGWSKTYQIA